MELHRIEFLRRKFARLIYEAPGDAEFSDVMEEGGPFGPGYIVVREVHRERDEHGINRDPLRMSDHRWMFRVDKLGEDLARDTDGVDTRRDVYLTGVGPDAVEDIGYPVLIRYRLEKPALPENIQRDVDELRGSALVSPARYRFFQVIETADRFEPQEDIYLVGDKYYLCAERYLVALPSERITFSVIPFVVVEYQFGDRRKVRYLAG